VLIDGRFTLIERLGRGASSTVWRARDERRGGEVALKLFAPRDPEAQLRFDREIAALSAVAHPRLPCLIATARLEDGGAYLAMPLFEGDALSARLGGAHAEVKVRALGLAICDPLSALHRAGLVHRDLKPEHVIIDSASDFSAVSLIDMGLALAASDPRSITAGNVVGTFGYLPPEQLRSPPAAASPRWDVFSLGCILYECATGQAPFAGLDRAQIAAKMLADSPPTLRETGAAVSLAMDELVRAMIASAPEQRPADADAVRAALSSIEPESSAERAHSAIAVIVGHPAEHASSAQQTTDVVTTHGAASGVDRASLPSGAWVTETADGAALIVLRAERVDRALVVRALQCALLLSAGSDRRWCVSASLGALVDRWPRGPALQRALALRAHSARAKVVTDAHTALFADGAFALAPVGPAFVVEAPRAS
jgi:serine/threonine protein kinase